MYCFRCGKKLPGREINCPDCDTPKRKRQRRRRRMVAGLFIFLSGAFVGSLFDTYLLKGEAWKHSILSHWFTPTLSDTKPATPITTAQNNTEAISIEAPLVMPQEKPTEAPMVEPIEAPVEKTIAEPLGAPVNEPVNDPVVAPMVESSEPTSELTDESEFEKENIATETAPIAKADPIAEVTPEEETAPRVEAAPIEAPKYLIYKSVSPLEAGDSDNYHGYVSADNKELVFASNRKSVNNKPTYQCFIKEATEKAEAKLLFPWNGDIWTPELTPDSNWVVFSSNSTKPEHIFLYDRKSGNSMALTSGESKNMMPAISPDGKKIAFVSNRSGKYCIWIQDLFNPKNVKQITKGNVNDREPRWTADGKALVFTRIIQNMKISHIMKVSVDPVGEPEILVSDDKRNWMADVSPDGNYLAYTRSLKAGGSQNVIILRDLKSGKEETLAFPGIYESFRPVWYKDCSGFVFHIAKKSGKCLYKANFIRE